MEDAPQKDMKIQSEYVKEYLQMKEVHDLKRGVKPGQAIMLQNGSVTYDKNGLLVIPNGIDHNN